ncbi:MAG: ATP-binding protein [Candidatus Dormibacteria bacterium]
MRLVAIRVRGFRRIRDLLLDLDHPRVVVVGPNEAGKSSLMEAVRVGIFGLDPGKRGRGHTAALREIAPWDGGVAGVGLTLRMDDGHLVETDWNLTAERTQVIDHTTGEAISTEFAGGTHGWRDIGAELTGIPGPVFNQVACLSEGELARLSDPVQLRLSLLQVADSGADVMVEKALQRLEEGARQATIPTIRAATRRNHLQAELDLATRALATARGERLRLQARVTELAQLDLEVRDATAASKVAGAEAADCRAALLRERVAAIEELSARLATSPPEAPVPAELRMRIERSRTLLDAARRAIGGDAPGDREWSDTELAEAAAALAAPFDAPSTHRGPPWTGVAVGLGAASAIAAGTLGHNYFLVLLGLLVAVVAVVLLTRGGNSPEPPLLVGSRRFRDRGELMTALQAARERAVRSGKASAVEGAEAEMARLLREAGAEGESTEELAFAYQALLETSFAAEAALASRAADAARLDALGGGLPVEAWRFRATTASTAAAGVVPATEDLAELETRAQEAARHLSNIEVQREGVRAALEVSAERIPEVAPLEERVAEIQDQVHRLEDFGRACRVAADTLRAQSESLRRAYAPRLCSCLQRDLPAVTAGRYEEALVDDDFRVSLRVPETGSMTPLALLSRGTQQQVHLLLRLGLLEVMGGRERLPLLLDDALALSDDTRRRALLEVIEAADRQVIYFTAGEAAAAVFGEAWRRIDLPL